MFNFKNLLYGTVLVPLLISGFSTSAKAGIQDILYESVTSPYRRTYKKSNIGDWEREKFCAHQIRNSTGRYVGNHYEGDSIVCRVEYYEDSNWANKVPSRDYNVGGPNYSGGSSTDGLRQQTNQNASVRDYRFHQDRICNYLHPGRMPWGQGLYVGDGGSACYDSYMKFR